MSPQDGRISPIHESSSNDSSFFEVLKKRRVAEKPKEIHGVTREDRPAPEPNDADVAKTRNDRISLLTAWWREVVSLAIATAAFIAIIVTMVKYNKKEQPTWKHAINLNTLIAILSTLLRACMVLVIEEVISQLKWMLFRKPMPLRQLAHFDAAARGPWGSLRLLSRTKTLDPALIGCIVLVLSVGIGPLSQQAIKSMPCDQPSTLSGASIETARYMQNPTAIGDRRNMDTRVAILNGLVSSNTARFTLTPDCSSGNCTFPSYNGISHSSIGMCRKCANVTPWLAEKKDAIDWANGNRTAEGNIDIVLPDGSSVGSSTVSSLRVLTITGRNTIWKWNHPRYRAVNEPWNGTFLAAFGDEFQDVFTSSIFNVSIVTFTEEGCEYVADDDSSPGKCSDNGAPALHYGTAVYNTVATSCSFYPCVRDYHGSVQNARFYETIIAETPVLQPPGQEHRSFPNFQHFHMPCQIDGQVHTANNIYSIPKADYNFTKAFVGDEEISVPTQCVFGMLGLYALTLGSFMRQMMLGDCGPRLRDDNTQFQDCDPWYIEGLGAKNSASFETLDASMQAVALAITSEIRKQGLDYDSIFLSHNKLLPDQPPIYVRGTVIRTAVCTQFDWKWLAFPVALLASTMILLCITCGRMLFDRHRIPAWKSSILPLLFAGRSGSVARDLYQPNADPDKLIVRLAYDEKGWEFVSEHGPQQGERK